MNLDERMVELANEAGMDMVVGGTEMAEPIVETPLETVAESVQVPEPVMTDTPAAEPITPTATTTVQDDNILEKLNKQLGTSFADLSEIPNLVAENSRLSQAEQQIIVERNQYQNPFANDTVSQFNEFVKKTGILDYNVFSKVANSDPATISNQEALALAMVIKKPKMAENWELTKRMAVKGYQIEAPEEGELESEDSQYARMQLEADADVARAEIAATKAKLTAEPVKIDSEAETRRMESLTPVATQLVEKLSKREYPLGIGDERFVFTVPAEAMPEYVGAALDYAKRNGLKADKHGMEEMAKFIDYNIRASYQDDIIKSYGETLRSEAYREKVKHLSNPSVDKPQQPIAESVGDPDWETARKMFPKIKPNF